MTYYQLPRTNFLSHKYIDCITDENGAPVPIVSNSLSGYLYEIKEELDKQEKDWDIFKKYTNPYEYIHTQLPNKKKCISKCKPLSRSYFKMIEMIHIFNLYFDDGPVSSFHLAEGPGGFIEAFLEIRQCPEDQYIGMTILDDKNDPNIPAWKKTENFLRHNKNVFIEKGADQTGNILSLENFMYCKNKYGSTMDFITADGGFDFSLDFNRQEINIAKLLFAQISFALAMQKSGGTFILKIFDSFMQHTVDLLYILSSFYEKTFIIKPQTSRYANSEKYVVCKGYLEPLAIDTLDILYRAFEKMLATPDPIHRFISIPIPVNLITRLEEYNAIFGQQQIENIYFTISLMKQKNKQDRIDNLVKSNIQKCVAWCTKYNVPYSISVINNNITNANNTNNYDTKLAPPPGLPIPPNLLNQPLSDFRDDASTNALPQADACGTALLRNILRL
jgi:23S rRNA U2552 (ribose-2'-O)-methylase RlmE/FtsJ